MQLIPPSYVLFQCRPVHLLIKMGSRHYCANPLCCRLFHHSHTFLQITGPVVHAGDHMTMDIRYHCIHQLYLLTFSVLYQFIFYPISVQFATGFS